MLYEREYLNEISFPLGGIGTGSIGLAGNGRLIDWEIFNRPNKGGANGYTNIVVRVKEKNGKTFVKVLNGDILKDLTGTYKQQMYSGFGFGPDKEWRRNPGQREGIGQLPFKGILDQLDGHFRLQYIQFI